MSFGKLETRLARSTDVDACLRLHNEAFGPRWTREHWLWRFVDNPLHRSDLFGAFAEDGRCAAVHAGVTLPFVLRGAETLVANLSDVAVHPELRRSIAGAKLLTSIARRYFEYIGASVSMIWGYPEPGLRRVVTRFCRVEILGDIVFLVRDTSPTPPPPADVEIGTVDRFGPDVDELWASCKTEFGAAVRRDPLYLNWRYAAHPSVRYTLIEARDRGSGALRGIAVLREGGWTDEAVSLCDWLVPETDRDAEHALVHHAIGETDRAGLGHLVCYFPPSRFEFGRFQYDHGFRVHGTPFQQGFRSWVHGVDRNWLHDHWYQTKGDMDFF